MLFYSTNNKQVKVTLEEAVMQGLAHDRGLFMPEQINPLPPSLFQNLRDESFTSIAYQVARNFITAEEVSDRALEEIIGNTVTFDVPLVQLEDAIWSLELYHGNTFAFKDFGAKFMAGLLGHFVRGRSEEVTILVATSGDTGSAVANGFHRVPGTRVIVLYPSGKVSKLQEKQMTTLGDNVIALEVDGTFDDCQRLVKMSFLDPDLRKKIQMTSANSINIARLIPQSFYYFFAVAQLPDDKVPVVFSVPSGNFGNLTGGVLAMKMGLPVSKFIASTNINDTVPEFLKSGKFTPRPSVPTISNAMDVGDPSNFARLQDLFNYDFEKFSSVVKGYACTDDETRETMGEVRRKFNYILDPHGAVAYRGLKAYQKTAEACYGVFLETAHPGKFEHVVNATLGESLTLPAGLQQFLSRKKLSITMSNQFADLKDFLLSQS